MGELPSPPSVFLTYDFFKINSYIYGIVHICMIIEYALHDTGKHRSYKNILPYGLVFT